MTDQTKQFHIGDILSVITGRLVSLDHIGGVYNILGWMTSEDLMTHQLPRVADECAPFLREQFPDLAAVTVPDNNVNVAADLPGWLTSLGPQWRDVPLLPSNEHARIDPLLELASMVGHEKIIPVVITGADR